VLIFQPLTAAYYPLGVMPPALQAVALAFPPTYVFEAARAGLSAPEMNWAYASIAGLENAAYFALALWFFDYMYRRSRQTGQFARNEE
jgi:ABC-2 type transport system permease protein